MKFRPNKSFYDQNKYEEAYSILMKIDAKILPEVQNLLGDLYLHGKGTETNYSLATKSYLYSLKNIENLTCQGKSDIQYNLAQSYYLVQNYKKAKEYFLSAAKLHNAPAQQMLAFMYWKGLGVKKNIPEAYAWVNISTNYLNQYVSSPEILEGLQNAVGSELMSQGEKAIEKGRLLRKEYGNL